MRSTKMIVCLGALAACVGVPSLSVAEDNCSGYYVIVGAMSISINTDPGDPSTFYIGECSGERCTRKDKDGDEYTVEHAYTPGDEKATWKIVSGTGKYAKARSSGWYKQTRADGDVLVGVWGGTCN